MTNYYKSFCFISINYGTSSLIANWVNHIRDKIPSAYIIIVDNYFSNNERSKIEAIAKKLNFKLIKSANEGYGSAINKGVKHLRRTINNYQDFIFFMGNADLTIKSLSQIKKNDIPMAYIPKLYEKSLINKNPYINIIQSRTKIFYLLAAFFKSSLFYKP